MTDVDSEPQAAEVSSKHHRRLRVTGGVLVTLVVAFTVFFAIRGHIHTAREHRERIATVEAGPSVQVAEVTPSPKERDITLTGESHPFQEATIYAKISGYLEQIRVDKGDKVKKNDLLAIVRSPETTAQWAGAGADARNKKRIAHRMRQLRKRELISPQEEETATSAAKVASAKLKELSVLRGYEELRAPFAGTITARFADPGALIQDAANSQTAAMAIVTLAEIDVLRIYVYVDQRYAGSIKPGIPVRLLLPGNPRVHFNTSVTRVSDALDPTTRMMLTEIDFDNSKSEIVAGSFVSVTLRVPTPVYPEIPVDAVVQRGDELVTPVVEGDTVHYRKIQAGDNDGHVVQILSGLSPGERVARQLGLSVADGSRVSVLPPSPATASQPPMPPSPTNEVGDGGRKPAGAQGGDGGRRPAE